jgi:hypothetical protein
MPKIPPRPEITNDPLYQATMAAQHIAYQLMREVPADRKAEAAKLHAACVHMTTWATYALEPDAAERAGSYRGLGESAADVRRRLPALSGYAGDEKDMDALVERLDEIGKAVEAALATAA